MELHFYGKKIDPPDQSIAEAFGAKENPILLKGGQGTSYRAGHVVLKPSEDDERSNWMAETFLKLLENSVVRFARPIKSVQGNWMHKDYVAWIFLEGEHVKGEYDKKLSASRAFHELLKDIPKPDFLNVPKSSWAVADIVAWNEDQFDYDQEFMDLFSQIKSKLKPLSLKSQLIHGDLSGNFIFHPGLPPAVIDFSPTWAPNGFAEGIMLVDAITWEDADPESLEVFKKIPDIEQFAWRGILRRITEQAEHIKWLGKPKEQAVKEARAFQKAIDFLATF